MVARWIILAVGLVASLGVCGCPPAGRPGPSSAGPGPTTQGAWVNLLEGSQAGRWKVAQGTANFEEGCLVLNSGGSKETTVLAEGVDLKDGVVEVEFQRSPGSPDDSPLTVALRLAMRIDWSSVYIVCRPLRVDAVHGTAFHRRPEVAEHFQDIERVADGRELWRFELAGQKVECLRFGRKLLSYVDRDPRAGTIALTAANCRMTLSAIRYRFADK